MNKRKVALGPGAASLILIVVMLSLCMLAMLMQIGSRNDNSLTTRSSEMISRVYQLNERAERRLAELGFYQGYCSGKILGGTVKAIQAFQRSQGIYPSGEVDQKTLDALFAAETPAPTAAP